MLERQKENDFQILKSIVSTNMYELHIRNLNEDTFKGMQEHYRQQYYCLK